MRSTTTRAAVAGALLSLAGAPAASADIFVTTERQDAITGRFDLAKSNVATGETSPLPASVNTTPANELHPALSPDGKRLAFLRRDLAAGTTRVVVVDLASGASADLFSGFEAAASRPRDRRSRVTARTSSPADRWCRPAARSSRPSR